MNVMNLQRDESGAVLVEFALVLIPLLVLVGGIMDLTIAFWECNAAKKAVERGARIAAVSDPVASGLNSVSNSVPSNCERGAALPVDAFQTITCDGSIQTCSFGGAGAAPTGISFSETALDAIVYGRGNHSCNTAAASAYAVGMCNIFPGLKPANVILSYRQTGLGFCGRPGGPVPTITVSLQNVGFHFFFLHGLLGFENIIINSSTETITAESMSSGAQ